MAITLRPRNLVLGIACAALALTSAALAAPLEPGSGTPPPRTVLELLSVLDPTAAKTIDPKILSAMEAKLAAFRDGLPKAVANAPRDIDKADPGAPINKAFIKDLGVIARQLVASKSGVVLRCRLSPCIQRLDLDGDGKRELVADVVSPVTRDAGVAIYGTKMGFSILGAGQKSSLSVNPDRFAVWQQKAKELIAGAPYDMRGEAVVFAPQEAKAPAELLYWNGTSFALAATTTR
ncbi:MAG: hypothetical protein HYV63_14075 [Candidatus Schekmanbacteria bacterium]|nr:hypothetical protein [Candidatus Schekmanbacteria bacterium]